MNMSTQLTLGISLNDDATFDNFYPGDNASLLSCLQTNTEEPFIYLWGSRGTGRTHLLQACCHAAALTSSVIYLSLKHDNLQPEVLTGMEKIDLVCLDDIDAIMGNRDWEHALFHFYNRARESGTRLYVTANVAPSFLETQLPDLRSRLSAGLTWQVHVLNDDDKRRALQMRAHDRGMTLSDDVANFLMHHFPRDMHALFHALEVLDDASLEQQRRITIPFVKAVLN